MLIQKSEFYISMTSKQVEDNLPQIAFVGRSNVGKSSLINMLTQQKKLARTSSTPGRTRLINYFKINDSLYFVDLPGYGYAKASQSEVQSWQKLAQGYLNNNSKLKLVCVLLDIRHKPNQLDKMMVDYLDYYKLPFIIIATKSDKLSKSKVKPACNDIASALQVGKDNIYPVSCQTGYNKELLLSKFDQFLSNDR